MIQSRSGRFDENVMLSNKVPCARVQRACEKGREKEVIERIRRCPSNEENVEGDLEDDVQDVDACEGYFVDEDRADGVED